MASHIDFRYLDEGLGGARGKRKRREEEEEAATAAESMDVDDDVPRPSKLRAVPSLSDPSKPAGFGQPTYDGVIAGRVSGRIWKQPRTKRSSAVMVSRKPVPLEQRVKDKSLKKAYQARKAELKEEIRQNKIAKRTKRQDREKLKKENVLRTGSKLQKVTNPKTIQKIAKSKNRHQLRVVSDEIFGKKKSEDTRRMQVPGLEN